MLYLSPTSFPDVSVPSRSSISSHAPSQSTAQLQTRSISLVLPCFNEEANIEQTIRAAQQWFGDDQIDGEIIATDDGSADASLAILHRLQGEMRNLRVVRHETNQGYGAAVRSGCDQATKQWIAFMDADGQFKASDLARLLPLTIEADYIAGVREKRADRFQRRLNGMMYNLFVRLMLGVRVTDVNCGMKLFRRSIWSTIRPVYASGALVNAEIFSNLSNAGIGWKEEFVPHYPRLAGTPTGANPRVILRMFKELWRLKRSLRRTGGKPQPHDAAVPVPGHA